MGPGGIDAVAGAIGSQGNGLTQDGLSKLLEAALAGRLRQDEPKTLLEMLQEGEEMKPSGARQKAARSALVGAEGGIQYARADTLKARGDRVMEFVEVAQEVAKLANAAGGAAGA